MIRVFIGYDSRETVAFNVLSNSIQRHASRPVAIVPLVLSQLPGLMWRDRHNLQSTDFSFSRFLVPQLCDHTGWAIFMDCDMLCRADIAELAAYPERSPDKAVLVCKHDYTPGPARKFLDQVQTKYPRKNWSSVMLFNNARCKALTPDYVNSASGLDLHRFTWLKDEQIGAIPLAWNWLVGEYKHNPAAKIAHYTIGGPYFDEYRGCDYAEEWFEENRRMNYAANRAPP